MEARHVPRRLKCKATVKNGERKGQRCGKWARDGFAVCASHGAGTRKRVKDGTRKDPAIAALKHGLYANRSGDQLKAGVADYLEHADELYRIDVIAARLWALLEQADVLADAINAERIAELEGDELLTEVNAAVSRLNNVRGVLSELLRTILAHEKIRLGGVEAITKAQIVGYLLTFAGWVHGIASDEAVPRTEIASGLLTRMQAHVELVGHAAADA